MMAQRELPRSLRDATAGAAVVPNLADFPRQRQGEQYRPVVFSLVP